MQYPGNPALAPDVQQRILGTYLQTLELAARGSRQEALLGCDFILRMDPAFRPARELQVRVNASAAGAPVSVADLAPGAGATVRMPALGGEAPPPAVAPPPAAPPVAPRPAAVAPPASLGPPAGGGTDDDVLQAALEDLLARRDLRRLVQAAEENRAEVGASPALRKLVETAYSRLEAEPYVKNFLESARAALGRGDFGECDRALDKARSLDPTYPGVVELAVERAQSSAPDDPWAGMPPELARGFARPGASGSGALTGYDMDPGLISASDSLAELESATGARPGGAAGAGDGRIAQLLEQGQQAFDRSDYQGSIDAWSRIFLIDIDHDEAAQRIEQARRLKAESERRVEEVFHEAVAAFDAGDNAQAQRLFERVLALQPSYFAAREYLEQLGAPAAAPDVDDYPPIEDLGGDGMPVPGGGALQEEILVPPAPSTKPTGARPAVTKRPAMAGSGRASQPQKRGGAGSRFLVVGGAVLALLLAAGVFAWMNKGLLFPNSKPVTTARKTTDELARARKLHDEGKVEVAVRQLRLLEPEHPRYKEAQELLAAWEAELVPQEPAADEMTTPAAIARFERDLARGKEALAAGEHLLADAYFRRARRLAPLPVDVEGLASTAAQKLVPLEREIGLFRQQEWTAVLPSLWRLRESDPGNKDVTKLMVDSYYNLAVRDLQGGDIQGALDKLDQALDLKPGDDALERNRSFAAAYSRRPKDLLYRIYVSHLPVL